jgi:uncharacterized protein (TIGR02677 family)
MDEKRLTAIPETAYLSAENVRRYRGILNYFYVQHEKMRQYLFPEEVYHYLRQAEAFSDYTEDQLQQDLKQLVEWRNLIPRQETGRVMTIEDFKRKKFRYQCTPYTVEIERMVERLHEIGNSFGGSLETTMFERLFQSLSHFQTEASTGRQGAELNQAWEDVYSYFKKIVQSASDYLAHLKSEKVEERMMTEAFLVYKDSFAEYLRKFILGLQQVSYNIESTLRSFAAPVFDKAAGELATYQLAIPRLEESISHAQFVRKYQDQWQGLTEWFLGTSGHSSELTSLENETTETIRRITRFAQRLGEKQQNSRSRYKDYLHLAMWFAKEETIAEAHCLSAVLFGLSEIRHVFAEAADSQDMYRSVWDGAPMLLTVKPRTNLYREKSRPGAVVGRTAEKAEALEEYLIERRREQALIESVIEENKIVIAQLSVQEPFIRKTLLAWIGKCMANEHYTAKTEQGRRIRLVRQSAELITLVCCDGHLTLPDFVIEFLS